MDWETWIRDAAKGRIRRIRSTREHLQGEILRREKILSEHLYGSSFRLSSTLKTTIEAKNHADMERLDFLDDQVPTMDKIAWIKVVLGAEPTLSYADAMALVDRALDVIG